MNGDLNVWFTYINNTSFPFFNLAHERIGLLDPHTKIPSDEQDPGTTPVTESLSTSTKSSLKKMYLLKKTFKNEIKFET
jgi:hypothetical protein